MTQFLIVSYVVLLSFGLVLLLYYSKVGDKLNVSLLDPKLQKKLPLLLRVYVWIFLGWIGLAMTGFALMLLQPL